MADTLTETADDPARPMPEFPMPRAAGCPFAPPPGLERLRDETPIAKVRIWDGSTPWLITGHAHQRAILTDPRLSNDEKFGAFPHVSAYRAEIAQVTPKLITNTDAPEHTRLRRMVNGPLLLKRVEALRPAIQKIVDDLIDGILAGPKPADLLTALALPVPSLVISELLGVRYEDHEFFQHNSNIALDRDVPPDEARAASGALSRYLDELLTEKLAAPGADAMSEMAARVTAGEMTRSEAVHMGVAMLIAGHETTATMISLGTLALLENPDQLAVLRDTEDPKVIAGAVEELLRYLSIVHSGLRRVAREDIEIGGQVIRAGEGVVVEISAANWDSAAFPEAERLDLTRNARLHNAFGFGPHQCLGQSLARVELQVVYGTLYRRIPTLRLATAFDGIEFEESGTTYGVRSLPVTW
ncbi:putative cytochrome P450 hydroxylase [Streptomyces sp. L-9-10]|uniref:cytochrome P450 n=1 Tax=Streptomyces sp. L-9-10 TaxID=1478131 RepID=UPI00101C3785|nr:cytochrome P450 [Streptomyces sp. L-9-10]RYJ27540.1 putative cytochrome P450 hydroxylase [Streptomyces sp. L-9-10]